MAISSDIQFVADEIAKRFHPERIILFGSHAYGNPTEDSDVDMLVIMQTALRPIEQATRIRSATKRVFPLDLLVRTPEQIRQRLEMGDSFIEEITSRGKVLYEGPH